MRPGNHLKRPDVQKALEECKIFSTIYPRYRLIIEFPMHSFCQLLLDPFYIPLMSNVTHREVWTDASGSRLPPLSPLTTLVSGSPGLSRILVGRPSFSMKLFSRLWLIRPATPRAPLPEKTRSFSFLEKGATTSKKLILHNQWN